MNPREFLSEELANVERALSDTLRHDYGPERSTDYYIECAARLEQIQRVVPQIAETDYETISDRVNELAFLSTWISLIERSHLGEFSWPFAVELRRMADALLAEATLKNTERTPPIVHVVAEGRGYRIVIEPEVRPTSSNRRFIIIAFPRSLKYHVLLHAIFGHELGHAALHTVGIGGALNTGVVAPLIADGEFKDDAAVNSWLHSSDAPSEVKNTLSEYEKKNSQAFQLTEHLLEMWRTELICDLFGLLLFGPAFFAAHRALLQPTHHAPHTIDPTDPTHPPYAVRHNMLVRAMHLLKWHNPIVEALGPGPILDAERAFLGYTMNFQYEPWAKVFSDLQLTTAIEALQTIFGRYADLAYKPLEAETLVTLVRRLEARLPPILASIDSDGKPVLPGLSISQILYAGWVYWQGRNILCPADPLSFFLTNRLCDHALLQQCAITYVTETGAE